MTFDVITENISRIKSKRCYIEIPQKGRGKRPIRKEGTVVGAYYYPYAQTGHLYHTYHILFDNGTKDTFGWRDVNFID